jgi:hypothetical protein
MTESAGRFSLHDPKTAILARVISEKALSPTRRLLVDGCGDGVEAATLVTVLKCEVTGIDLDARFEPEAIQIARLQRGDALALEFADGFTMSFTPPMPLNKCMIPVKRYPKCGECSSEMDFAA